MSTPRGREAWCTTHTMEDTSDVGQQLRRARLAAGLTMRELARRADLSHQLVEKVEGGQNTTIETLDRLAVAAEAELVVRIEGLRPRPRVLPPADRLAIASRLLAVLPRLPDDVVDDLLQDVALWEAQNPPGLGE